MENEFKTYSQRFRPAGCFYHRKRRQRRYNSNYNINPLDYIAAAATCTAYTAYTCSFREYIIIRDIMIIMPSNAKENRFEYVYIIIEVIVIY